MSVTRRLLVVAGGGGTFAGTPASPPPSLVTLTSAPDGGWTQIPESRALVHAGYLYFAYVDGTSGDVEVRAATSDGATVYSSHALHGSALNTPEDSHDCPGLIVMDDGHLMAIYSAHNGTTLYRRISTNTVDSDPTLSGGFAAEATIRGSGAFTYPIVMQRMSETNQPIYVWYRSGSAGSTKLVYSKSTDHGSTWSHSGTIWADGAAYWKVTTDGLWRIDFFVTEGNPADPTSRIFHFYADDEAYKASDGTPIGDPPHNSGTGPTLVYDSSDGPGWVTDGKLYGSGDTGTPVFIANIDNGSFTDSEFRYYRWNGSSWDATTLVASVGAGIVDPSPVGCLDDADQDRLWLTRLISGVFEVYEYTSAGSGTAVTSGSSDPNIYPARVHDHGTGEVAMLWLTGSYTGAETAFDLGIKGST